MDAGQLDPGLDGEVGKCVGKQPPQVLGTDQFPYEPNEGTTATIREAELYVDAGMTPLRALRTATTQAAAMLRLTKDVGSLAPGHFADVLAVKTNPLADIGALRSIDFVMKGGQIVRSDAADAR